MSANKLIVATKAPTNRVFFPQPLLDGWLEDERVELLGDVLVMKDDGRRYRIEEAAHVTKDVAGGGDVHDLLGRVKTKRQLESLAAEHLETSLIVGEDAYDIVPGFAGTLLADPNAVAPSPTKAAPSVPQNEDDLLAQFLMKSL